MLAVLYRPTGKQQIVAAVERQSGNSDSKQWRLGDKVAAPKRLHGYFASHPDHDVALGHSIAAGPIPWV